MCNYILHSNVQISLQGKMATGASTNISIGKLLGVMHSVKYQTYQWDLKTLNLILNNVIISS